MHVYRCISCRRPHARIHVRQIQWQQTDRQWALGFIVVSFFSIILYFFDGTKSKLLLVSLLLEFFLRIDAYRALRKKNKRHAIFSMDCRTNTVKGSHRGRVMRANQIHNHMEPVLWEGNSSKQKQIRTTVFVFKIEYVHFELSWLWWHFSVYIFKQPPDCLFWYLTFAGSQKINGSIVMKITLVVKTMGEMSCSESPIHKRKVDDIKPPKGADDDNRAENPYGANHSNHAQSNIPLIREIATGNGYYAMQATWSLFKCRFRFAFLLNKEHWLAWTSFQERIAWSGISNKENIWLNGIIWGSG